MKKWIDSWGVTVVILLVGSGFFALTASGPDRDFGRTFLYAAVGFSALTASMIATLMTIGRFGRGTEHETAALGIALLIGIFITSPAALWLAFQMLDKLMGW